MAYLRPPIVEAVIELRFEQSADDATIAKVAAKFKADYPNVRDERQVSIDFSTPDNIKQTPAWQGKRLSSSDEADIIAMRTTSYACMRLAPYRGWDEFVKTAREGWEVVAHVIGKRTVSRVGVRYVNRIDIPTEGVLEEDEYLNFYPKAPALDWGPMSNYVVQATRPLNVDGCSVIMNSGPTPSPLMGYGSLLLDIDVFADGLRLLRSDEVWELVAKIRNHKNRIFESCITDKARGLFE